MENNARCFHYDIAIPKNHDEYPMSFAIRHVVNTYSDTLANIIDIHAYPIVAKKRRVSLVRVWVTTIRSLNEITTQGE